MIDPITLKQLLNKRIQVRNSVGGGLYEGVVLGFRPGQFCLGQLAIINAHGGATVSKYRTTRWFKFESSVLEGTA